MTKTSQEITQLTTEETIKKGTLYQSDIIEKLGYKYLTVCQRWYIDWDRKGMYEHTIVVSEKNDEKMVEDYLLGLNKHKKYRFFKAYTLELSNQNLRCLFDNDDELFNKEDKDVSVRLKKIMRKKIIEDLGPFYSYRMMLKFNTVAYYS